MKTLLLLIVTSLLIFRPVAFAGGVQGILNFENSDVSQILPIYEAMSGRKLVVDSRVKSVRSTVTLKPSQPLEQDEALKQIEKALLEQTGVVITRLDDHQASVTYNDALPISRPKK